MALCHSNGGRKTVSSVSTPEERGEAFVGLTFGVWTSSPVPTSVPMERRAASRFPCRAETLYELAGEDSGGHPAWVDNISVGGILLRVQDAHEPGTLLHVEIPGASTPRRILSCIRHTRPVDEDFYAIGCSFIRELSQDELFSFLEDAKG